MKCRLRRRRASDSRTHRVRAAFVRGADLSRSAAAFALAGITLISVPQEIAIGKEENAQVRKETPQVTDAAVTAYVSRIGARLAKSAPGAKYPYGFAVADYGEINAFSLPGGPVWINRGVLRASTNESQVAGVLAHEIAHIAQRHAADQMTKVLLTKWSLSALGAMLGNAGGAGGAQAAGAVMANGVFLKFSRDDESEADRVGLAIMTKAGWDARGMIELFETLRREQQRDPSSVEVFFSTHPSPADRVAALSAATAQHRGGIHDTPEFRAVKARVLKLPPPHKMPK